MGIKKSFNDLSMVEYPDGFLSISIIIMHPTSSLIHLNWYANKQDAESGSPHIKQTCYEVNNSIFTNNDFHARSYEYIMTLSEFSDAILEDTLPIQPVLTFEESNVNNVFLPPIIPNLSAGPTEPPPEDPSLVADPNVEEPPPITP